MYFLYQLRDFSCQIKPSGTSVIQYIYVHTFFETSRETITTVILFLVP